ncbi:MAG: hypothetical protein R2688_06030 [Fimbriimonadaceae bacterium]
MKDTNGLSNEFGTVWNSEVEENARRIAQVWSKKLGFSQEDSEDFEQDALVSLFQKVKEGKIYGRVGFWVAIRNMALDRRSELVRRVSYPLDWEPLEIHRDLELPLLLEAIGERFPDLRAVAEARANGFEWELIAEAFDVPCGSLRVQWTRWTKKAREEFGDTIDQLLAGVN